MAPPAGLADHVVCTWTAVHEGGPSGPVLPDGCVDVLWIDGALVVAGPDTGPVFEPDLPVGGSVVGVRFRSGLAAAGLGVGVDDLRDTRTPLADVWPAAEVDRLGSQLAQAENPVLLLAAAVAGHARPVSDADRLVRAAVYRLRYSSARVADLAGDLDVGQRRLHRRFSSAVGYGPKTLDRIFRFERFRRLAAASPPDVGLADLAYAAGYSDQAHLTRECRRLAGETPVRIVQDARQGGPIPSAV
jgi:AraC-like DNA-binding protein